MFPSAAPQHLHPLLTAEELTVPSDPSAKLHQEPQILKDMGAAHTSSDDPPDATLRLRQPPAEQGTADAEDLGLSPRMRRLLKGLHELGDSGNPSDVPPLWLDRELFDRGKFGVVSCKHVHHCTAASYRCPA